jgi:WASH complex subunit strumpellin
VGFVRRVMEIIPRSVFKILTNIVAIKERHLKQLPSKVETDETKSYAQLDERYELAKLTHQVSIFTEGILAMEKTLLGVIQVDPRAILEDGIRKELVRQISGAMDAVLRFPHSDKDKDPAQTTASNFMKAIQALSNRVNGYRLAIEYIQDYVDLAGLRMWQSELCR